VPIPANPSKSLQITETTSTSVITEGAVVDPPNCNEEQKYASKSNASQQGINKRIEPFPPDLSMIIERWDVLPAHIRAAIMALIGTIKP